MQKNTSQATQSQIARFQQEALLSNKAVRKDRGTNFTILAQRPNGQTASCPLGPSELSYRRRNRRPDELHLMTLKVNDEIRQNANSAAYDLQRL
jgi:hypothetical protein